MRLTQLRQVDLNPAVKIVEAPHEMAGFPYLMIWHPRLHTDTAHVWLRATVRAAGAALAPARPSRRSRA